jgi:hypothetical protein
VKYANGLLGANGQYVTQIAVEESREETGLPTLRIVTIHLRMNCLATYRPAHPQHHAQTRRCTCHVMI